MKNSETIVVKTKDNGVEIIVIHDQTGSSYGMDFSKEAYEQLRLHFVSQRSELLIALKECKRWMINKGVNVESDFFKNIDKAINCG